MADDGAGLLSLGFSALGNYRSRPYRSVDSHLAKVVAACWQVGPDVTRHVSEPLANILDRYLPEKAKRAAEVGMDPFSVLVGLWSILSQCQAYEKAIVAQFVAAKAGPRPEQASPPESETAPAVDPAELAAQAADVNAILEPV